MASKRKRGRIQTYLFSYDMNLIVAVFFLIIFGLIMIYSASYYTAGMSKAYNYDPTFLLKSQAKYSVLGLAVMLIVANIDYHNWRYFAMLGLINQPQHGKIPPVVIVNIGYNQHHSQSQHTVLSLALQ